MNRSFKRQFRMTGLNSAFSQVVRSRLAADSASSDEHPDADLLNAFAERKLSQQDRNEVARHVAGCADCREILALASPAAPLADARTRREHRFRVRWAVAGLAAASLALVAIWQASEFNVRTPAEPARVIKDAAIAKIPNPVLSQQPHSRNGLSHATYSVPNSAWAARSGAKPVAAIIQQPAVFWRIGGIAGGEDGNDGTLQKSEDGGKTWIAYPLSKTGRFYSVAADGSSIWVGGTSGVLMHSDDEGTHWTRVTVGNSRSPVSETITRIETGGNQAVRLATDSGARWASSDGGVHWRRY